MSAGGTNDPRSKPHSSSWEPLGVLHVGLAAREILEVRRVHQQQLERGLLEDVPIGSDQGAVPVFRPVRFPGPPTEPDVRLATHPALHQVMPPGYAADTVVAHGVGMLPR